MPTETIRKGVAADVPPTTTPGTQKAANNVSQSNKKRVSSSGNFVRVGKIELLGDALKVTYTSFGATHTAYIGQHDTRRVQEPGAPQVDVVKVRVAGPGDTILSESIGKAWRSRTGRALILRTIDSQGEIMTPWKQFILMASGEAEYAALSRFGGDGE